MWVVHTTHLCTLSGVIIQKGDIHLDVAFFWYIVPSALRRAQFFDIMTVISCVGQMAKQQIHPILEWRAQHGAISCVTRR